MEITDGSNTRQIEKSIILNKDSKLYLEIRTTLVSHPMGREWESNAGPDNKIKTAFPNAQHGCLMTMFVPRRAICFYS